MIQQPEQIPDRVRSLRTNSLWLYRTWWIMHYLVGIVGVLAGGFAGAAATVGSLKDWGWFFGAVAALSTSLVTFLGPLQRAQRYWETFHAIDQTVLEYECGATNLQTLLQETKQARLMLLGTSVPRRSEDSVKPDAM